MPQLRSGSKVFTISGVAAVALVFCLLAGVSAERAWAHGELFLFLGNSSTTKSDLELRTPKGDILTLHDVSWKNEPFRSPFYYSLRYAYWLASRPRLAMAIDLTHDKVYLESDRTVRVTGRRAGARVDLRERVGDALPSFSASHGLNTLTIGPLYDLCPHRDQGCRVTPYLGFAVGISFPHIEATFDGKRTSEYRFGEPILRAVAGMKGRLGGRYLAAAEYRIERVSLKPRLGDGSKVSTDLTTQQFLFALGMRLGASAHLP